MKKITLKEIAQTLGISISTVSKALKDYPDVSLSTKQKVVDLAESLNFSPNSFAQSLRSKESKTIGVVVPNMVHYYFSSILDAILKESNKKGYMVIIMQSNEDHKLEEKQINLLLNKGVDGILISMANGSINFEYLQRVLDFGIPLVLFDKITKLLKCSKVIINDNKASYDVVTYLIKNGCKRIAYFRGDLNPQNSIDRFLGYKKALEDNGIQFDSSLVYLSPKANFEEGYANAKKLIEEDQIDVDAIYTFTDLTAIGAITYLNEKNIKIPDEIAVFGFSNWFMSSVITPTLSTVEQNAYKTGEKAIELLFKEIDSKQKGEPSKERTITIDTELVIRNST
ncbi:LacI family DNA-binding transcriptional regulator [Winogradskyella sp. KYW1333]|uniref:LacI family DNA-binding transcriptional regulator n=1 Tax=Winogradskyella sp. KYW1333 TaxID=2282123 RepID=UPI000DF1D691|nr:LacI family DNA-binding transcriptional regulator [Winogradskyella sp. KYW1333]RCT53980.1 LacI family transcriptional regulator [Winogradskyella sp. KYW1333]